MGFGDVPPEIGRLTGYSFRARTVLTPKTSGTHKISLAAIGPAKLYLDDELILEQDGDFDKKGPLFFTYGSDEVVTTRNMVAGLSYDFRIEYHSHDRQLQDGLKHLIEPMEDKFQGFRLGYEEVNPSDLPLEAAEIAKRCDAAVIVVGRDKEWETESQDIPCFELPGEQVRLIQQVSTCCKRVIVVVQAGTPVLMDPWIDQADAVLYTWYQGQELGNAVLDIISGQINPSGRLPVTFPRRLEDCPAFSSFPGELLESTYSEGLYIGYRWWDLVGSKPQFPIGFGLSFNSFRLQPESVTSTTLSLTDRVEFSVLVENIGGSDVPGRETVVVWFSQDLSQRLARPVKQICGFSKSSPLNPGEKEVVKIKTDAYAFGMFDPSQGRWVIDAGSSFTVLVGRNAQDATPAWQLEAKEEITWI
jgi:beta-glucosidase